MALLTHLFGKFANAVVLLLAVLVMNFCLIHLAPGDPVQVIAGEMGGASPEVIAALRAKYGLDHSLLEQLFTYLGKVAHGDFGYSYYFNQPVLGLILQRLPATLYLAAASLVVAVLIGTLLGVISARRPNGLLSHGVTVLALAGHAAPIFWTGLLLLLLFGSVWPILPVNGMTDVVNPKTGMAYVADVAKHLVLPSITLGLVFVAQYSRLARVNMIDVLSADYIRTAHAKGLPERVVLVKHALRNTLIPIVTVVGLQFGNLFAGAVLVETVYSWPGMGRLVYDSILRRDYPTLMGVLFFSALMVIAANILTDLVYRLIDPRIRAGAR
ncbi:peptide/nickel transport system permease protein [Rhodopseudomonas thermotolerans]|jgi:peptide/nickel transport system permease protein|uniref:Peptide/nickel transport system permease protein n=2 Tax=Rhodopseudomonas TaxID=1073 RepID=A0A336JY67_9BRAD|nr:MULTISPECIES: ABC transporter permease [Rhodopseudomonas]RED21543.1 peptide/nickel transport system permease protein [Rhodopseudomonas pentothenatexigens]REF86913.1 peptide/nickel transport system permease protein [Rhodopseudomonas thermotolerans]SSW93663.1 peptide/nickel transport system permease protein [Rhodopseudomonas pentothenatexigens]